MVFSTADGDLVLVVARVRRPDPKLPAQLRILAPGDSRGGPPRFSQVPFAEEAVYCRLVDAGHEVHAPRVDWR